MTKKKAQEKRRKRLPIVTIDGRKWSINAESMKPVNATDQSTQIRIDGLGHLMFLMNAVKMNERNEPPHIHVQKGDADAKYWLHPEGFNLSEAHAYRLSAADKRTVRQIIFEHFDYLSGVKTS